ncbi:unnamed protein product [Phytophthora fragariaefolia]|uniref:Unnamed protein product n=1 Tax=Phytophthora fragariaefolia TaxID=1490495 RepID=A0A9W7D973_9STRA|nr:unnamed protein product [Phytophthora fragariaefolia]
MKDLFRLDFSMMACLVKELSPHFVVDRDAPNAVPPPKRVAIFVYYCAQASSLVATADRFAIGPSTVSGIIKEVAAIVCQNLRELVAFPSFRQCASHFASCCGVPQIVGCIDGSHIPISKPAVDGTMYTNRKCWYSVVLQAVVDWRRRFCNVDCKWPGRVGDSRVFRNSMLGSAFPAVSATSDAIALPSSEDTHAEIPKSRTFCYVSLGIKILTTWWQPLNSPRPQIR